MKKYFLIMVIFIVVHGWSYSQPNLNKIDSLAISTGKEVIAKLLGSKFDASTCLLISLSNRIMVVLQRKSSYQIFNGFSMDHIPSWGGSNFKITEISDPSLDNFFKKCICEPNYNYAGKDTLPDKNLNSMTHNTYFNFVLYKAGFKKCEFNVPTTVLSNRRNRIPIKPKILKKLFKLMYPPDSTIN